MQCNAMYSLHLISKPGSLYTVHPQGRGGHVTTVPKDHAQNLFCKDEKLCSRKM